MSCMTCGKRDTCKSICDEVKSMLKNSKETNGFYADSTDFATNMRFDPHKMDKILYISNSMSEEERLRARDVVIAILSPEQKRLLNLYAEGKSQDEIADVLKISQSGVSQRFKAIKRAFQKRAIILQFSAKGELRRNNLKPRL